MSNVTQKELTALKELLAKATPGPWVSYIEGRDHEAGDNFIMTAGEDIYMPGASEADQEFVAAARQEVPRLIAEVERLQSLLRGKQTAAE